MDRPKTTEDAATSARSDDRRPKGPQERQSGPPSMPTHPLSDAPVLSAIAAAGALLAMLLHRLIVPAFSQNGNHSLWLEVERWGDFGANLAAVCGIIALTSGVRGFVSHNHHLPGGKRFLLLFFNVVFVGTIGTATIMDRGWTSAEVVWLALGEANVLCVILAVSALSLSPGRQARWVALATACMVLFGLTARVLERISLSLTSWVIQLRDTLEATGEIGYLVVLLVGTYWLMPRSNRMRDHIARLVGLSAGGTAAAGFIVSITGAPNDYKMLLYHSQRVRLLIDEAPQLYAVPICAAVFGAVSATLGSDRIRQQAGIGMLLLLSAGYAPRAPGGLMALTLATCLIARSAVASSWQPSQRPAPAPATS